MRKWYAEIKENDNWNGKTIKVGIVKKEDEYTVIANNGDVLNEGDNSIDQACDTIDKMYSQWTTFEWIERGKQ